MDRLWVPFSLRRMILLLYALLFALLATALGILYYLSNRNQGLATTSNHYHYLWTYGPSAIFTIISGCWVLVESNAKLLAPWRAMKRPTAAQRGLLLDYITENQYMTVYTSIKNADWDVFLAVAGALGLNALIILSTGLFTIQQKAYISPDTNFRLTSTFNGSKLIQQSGNALSTSYAIGKYGLDVPRGTTRDFAFQTANVTTLPPGTEAYVTVDAFYPNISCEVANTNWTFGIVYDNVTSPEGTAGSKIWATTPQCELKYARPFYNGSGSDTYFLDLAIVSCPGRNPNTTRHRRQLTNSLTLTDTSIAGEFAVFAGSMSVTDMNVTEAKNALINITGEDIEGDKSTFFKSVPSKLLSSKAACVFCSVTPELRSASLSINQETTSATIVAKGGNDKLNNTLPSQLQLAVIQALLQDSDYLTGFNGAEMYPGPELSVGKYSSSQAAFFELMNETDPQGTVDGVVDPNFLADSVPSTLRLIYTQLAAANLFQEAGEKTSGVTKILRNRLVIPVLSFSLTIGLLGLMTLVSLALCIECKATVPRSPASTLGLATILAQSRDVTRWVRDTGHSNTATKLELLKSGPYQAGTWAEDSKPKYGIKNVGAVDTGTDPHESGRPYKTGSTWWHPWATSWACRVLVFLLPIACIALLEVLYQRSERLQGVAEVSLNEYAQYAWVYLPVLAIFCVNFLFEEVSFTNRIIQPYVAMRKQPTIASRSVSMDLVHKHTIGAIYSAAKLRHFGVVAGTLATLLGAALPIAASGLFTPRNVSKMSPILLHQMNGFDPSVSLDTWDDYKEHLPLPAFIFYNNLSAPRWTYDKYAFPQLNLSSTSITNLGSNSSNNSYVQLDLPAVYGVANCTFVPRDDITYSAKPTVVQGPAFEITIESKTPAGCPRMALRDFDVFDEDFYLADWVGLRSFISDNDTTVVRNGSLLNSTAATYHGNYSIPAQCPLSVIHIAKGKYTQAADNSSTIKMEDIKVLHCRPYVEQETLDVSFRLPDFDIMPSKPPTPQPRTQKVFSEAEILNTGFFTHYLPFHTIPTDPSITDLQDIDRFFQAVFGGTGGILPSKVLGNDTDTLNSLLERIEYIYAVIVSQAYSGKRRFATSPSDPAATHNATLTTSNVARMQQDQVSTRILQALLAAMMLCAIVSMLLIDGRKVVPQNPCSIGAVASFLANSSILGEEVTQSESGLADEEAWEKRFGDQDGRLYSVGWWDGPRGRWFGIDVGRAEKEE